MRNKQETLTRIDILEYVYEILSRIVNLAILQWMHTCIIIFSEKNIIK